MDDDGPPDDRRVAVQLQLAGKVVQCAGTVGAGAVDVLEKGAEIAPREDATSRASGARAGRVPRVDRFFVNVIRCGQNQVSWEPQLDRHRYGRGAVRLLEPVDECKRRWPQENLATSTLRRLPDVATESCIVKYRLRRLELDFSRSVHQVPRIRQRGDEEKRTPKRTRSAGTHRYLHEASR